MKPKVDISSAFRRAQAGDSRDPPTLAELLCDENFFVRRKALANERAPSDVVDLLVRAGASADLRGKGELDPAVSLGELERLAALGPFGRELVAAHPNAHERLLERIASEGPRSATITILKHPNCPAKLLKAACVSMDAEERRLAATHPSAPGELIRDQIRVRLLEHPNVPRDLVTEAARHPHLEVRIAAARPANAPLEVLRALAADGAYQVREIVARHPQAPREMIDHLRRLGSAEDLLNFDAPDPELPAAEIADLVKSGLWPRRLAARHPNTDAATLQTLACDADHVVREWASRHPNMPADFLTLLERCGASRDLLGMAPPDRTFGPSELESIAGLGPWAARLVAQHPNTPESHLATDAIAGIRFALIHNRAIGDDVIAMLETDQNPDIATAAKARRGVDSPPCRPNA
ncbi:MAG: hypothetical protein ACYTG0_30550 [Planctomycetota bacterium]|jgi:hypothetical protein